MTDPHSRTYEGTTLDEILPKIRDELGEDAIVVRQREGLKGGVGGFFQKRVVEVEARPGRTMVAGPSFSATDGPAVGPERAATAPAPLAQASVADAMLAQAGLGGAATGFGAQLVDAAHRQETGQAPEPFVTGLEGTLTVDAILGGAAPAATSAAPTATFAAAETAHAQTATATMAPVMPAAAQARGRVVTSAQVDALPSAVAPRPSLGDGIDAMDQVATQPAPVPTPSTPPDPSTARAPRAERIVETLAARGLSRPFAERLVDDVAAHRAPLASGTRLATLVGRELAGWITARPARTPGVTAFAGAGGTGKTSAVAALARAYAEAGQIGIAVVAFRAPDGGAALRAALQGADVCVYVVADDADAVTIVSRLRRDGIVLVDTPAISPRNAAEVKTLGRRLAAMEVDEVQVMVPATSSLEVARDALDALAELEPTGMAITHADETERIGAAVQLSIDASLPLAYIHEGGTAGRGLRAGDAAELAKALAG